MPHTERPPLNHTVFLAANVQVHGHEFPGLVRIERFVIVLGVEETKKVPGRVNERVQGVRLSLR